MTTDTLWLVLTSEDLPQWTDALAQLATAHRLHWVSPTPVTNASFPPVLSGIHLLADINWASIVKLGAFVVGREVAPLVAAEEAGARIALWHQDNTPPPPAIPLAFADPLQLAFGLRREHGHPLRYRVTATAIHEKVAREFIKWMEIEHGPDLVACAGCLEFRVVRLDPARVSCEYIFQSRAALERYLVEDAPRLRLKGRERFPEHLMSFERHDDELVAQGFKPCQTF